MANNYLFSGKDWSEDKILESFKHIEEIAKEELELDYYPPQIEIIDSSRMLDLYASIGMPIMYNHWSFGKHYIQQATSYQKGFSGLALELVINCLSSDTYLYTKTGIKQLSDITVGEFIFNGKDYVKIKRKWSSKKNNYLEITLENGTKLKVSEDHVFPTIYKNGLENKKSKELDSDHFFLYNKKEINNENFVDLSDFTYTPPFMNMADKFVFTNYCEIPHYMSEDLAELMGIIIGDRCVSHTIKNAFQITVGHDAGGYENHIVSLIKKVFKIDNISIGYHPSQKFKDKNNMIITVCSQEIKKFLDFCGLKETMTHKNKIVPWTVMQSNKYCRAAFLRGLFDTDGYYRGTPGSKNKTLLVSCYNQNLAADVNLLINSLGIISKSSQIDNNHNNISVVTIKTSNMKKFCSIVGSNHPHKKIISDDISKNFIFSKYSNDSGSCSIVPEYFLKKYKEIKYKSTDKFLQKNNLDNDDNKIFEEFNLIKIKDIKKINHPIELIDIEVESLDHTFIANSILTHNCDPGICYLMDENTMTQQTMVMAHAIAGHGSFFKNNTFFKQWTDPGSIIDYLDFAKKYINDCEERYGIDAVEKVLDACHSLQDYGVDRYKKPKKLSMETEFKRQKEREEYTQKNINILWSTIPEAAKSSGQAAINFPQEPEENILYFIEKNAPKLEQWQRELVRIVRKIAQYFYPQKQTKVANEGFATFTHQYIMKRLHEKELIDDGSYMEFLACHSSVVFQPEFSSKYYNGFNPYALGSDILHDIVRICKEPTAEDEEWFPDLMGKDWKVEVKNAAYNYRDESFIQQFLSPTLIRKWKLFKVHNQATSSFLEIEKIHNEVGFKEIRKSLAFQHSLGYREPEILVNNVKLNGNRELELRHNRHNGVGLNIQTTKKVLQNLEFLWGYPVRIDSYESVEIADGIWDDRIHKIYDNGYNTFSRY